MFNIIAILFVGASVHVAYVGPDRLVVSFDVENSRAGHTEVSDRIRTVLRQATGKPLVCIGAAEGSALEGPVFEKLVLDEGVRRFMYARPKYLLDAKAASLPPTEAETLLKLCGTVFPVKQ
ncbi:MAG: hypothetical protein Q8R67_01290 [Rhodoferax sp.]|nr:hypothetical protein [Rhodoferax sp.]MDP3650292.1 hypothetical protein [Rhodoferax sp.]